VWLGEDKKFQKEKISAKRKQVDLHGLLPTTCLHINRPFLSFCVKRRSFIKLNLKNEDTTEKCKIIGGSFPNFLFPAVQLLAELKLVRWSL
jgi:hypothetical protein